MSKLKAFWFDEHGATAIEYAMIGASVSIVILAGTTTIGTKLVSYFTGVSNGIR